MNRALSQARQSGVSQYYFGYLRDAVSIFESAIKRLEQCENALCSIPDAIDMAHRIKGNAAMYDYAELGLKAASVEHVLRAATEETKHTNTVRSLRTLINEIDDICQTPQRQNNLNQTTPNLTQHELRPARPHDTLAVVKKPLASVSQSAQQALDRKSIFLAYNDLWLCELMASLLMQQFDVNYFHEAADLRNALDVHRPDLIILEDTLEGANGLSLLKELKSSRHLAETPVFIAFEPGASELIAEGISLGLAGFSADKHEILDITTFAKDLLDTARQSILVVDDDPVVRDLLTHTLTSGGYDVDIACDGLEALTYLSETKPDLVILDRFMPRLEGGTVLYEIQNKINLKSIPVLILTAMVNRGEARSWFERGAADFIPKPFDPEEVLMRVKQHLGTRQRIAC